MNACPQCGCDLTAPIVEPVRSFEFVIPFGLSSMNRRHVNAGVARFHYGKLRDDWTTLLINVRNQLAIPKPTGKSLVTITRCYASPSREWDYDNLVGGAKMVVDALKRAEMIEDDSPRWLTASYRQERGTVEGTRFVLSHLPGGEATRLGEQAAKVRRAKHAKRKA